VSSGQSTPTTISAASSTIAEDDPTAAQRVADRIDQTIQTLAATPTGRKGRVSGTYEKVVRSLPYIVVYALGDEPKGHETLTIYFSKMSIR
jgi:toxin ParE1/3/4